MKGLLVAMVIIFLLGTIGEKDPKDKEIYLTGLTIVLALLVALSLLG